MPLPSFHNLRVLIFESRRAMEMATLVSTFGGRPQSAPALREVPIEANVQALDFADRLRRNDFDVVVFLTGVGLRVLLAVVDRGGSREPFVAALARTRIVARGPKPLAVLRELGLTPWITVPEPNTWRELLAALDAQGAGALEGLRVAVQEYGASPAAFVNGLQTRGARVVQVPVYRYSLPDDLAPLHAAVTAIVDGEVDVALFTTATQVTHLLQVADAMGQGSAVRQGLRRVVIASIGPTTSEELREQGLEVEIEASHARIGFLVREAADKGPALVQAKRASEA
jgi:uroporphyrinogen-III synthase